MLTTDELYVILADVMGVSSSVLKRPGSKPYPITPAQAVRAMSCAIGRAKIEDGKR